MKKFQFKLETVLGVWEQRQTTAQKDLQEARALVLSIEGVIAKLKGEIELIFKQQEAGYGNKAAVMQLKMYRDYLEALKKKVALEEDELMRAQNVMESKRQVLMKIQRKIKTLEKLKEKKYADWEQELRKEEAFIADELAVTRYLRQMES